MSDDGLTPEHRADARAIFEGAVEGRSACHFCAGIHATVAGMPFDRQPCPRVRRVEWHPDGTVLSVEYWPPGRWEHDVIFPSDVYDEDDAPATS